MVTIGPHDALTLIAKRSRRLAPTDHPRLCGAARSGVATGSAGLEGQTVRSGGADADRFGGAFECGVVDAVGLLAGTNDRGDGVEAALDGQRDEDCAGLGVADGDGGGAAALGLVVGATLDQQSRTRDMCAVSIGLPPGCFGRVPTRCPPLDSSRAPNSETVEEDYDIAGQKLFVGCAFRATSMPFPCLKPLF